MRPIERENANLFSFLSRFEGRGFARGAGGIRSACEKQEEKTRQEMPSAYRLDTPEQAKKNSYCTEACAGRQVMSVDGYVAYFTARRPAVGEGQADTAETVAVSPAHNRERSLLVGRHTAGSIARFDGKKPLFRRTVRRVWNTVRVWRRESVSPEYGTRNRLPVAVIASFFVITLCLMMIISASVMVAGVKNEVSELKNEVSELKSEAEILHDKLEADIDYLEIYRVATEEYGMIDTAYVSAAYLKEDSGDTVEAFEEEQEVGFGLGTLLSAIGIDVGTH